MEIWVNPACSKCRAATQALDEAGVAYSVRRYLEDPPSRAELEEVLDRLRLEPWDIARTGEPEAVALEGLPRTDEARSRWLDVLLEQPRLIQRPIITADDGTAVVARDAESLARVLPFGPDAAGDADADAEVQVSSSNRGPQIVPSGG
jgi:arsenate reductase